MKNRFKSYGERKSEISQMDLYLIQLWLVKFKQEYRQVAISYQYDHYGRTCDIDDICKK